MHLTTQVLRAFPYLRLLAFILAAWLPASAGAETATPGKAGATAIDHDVADAILQELKAIRQVLNRIEKQGGTKGAKRKAAPRTATVPTRDKPSMGAANAPVTVVEFTDYQCPFCLRFTKGTFPHLKKKYIDTGKVRWVALNLPLSFHPDARKAAQGALCAGEQGKFWEMRAALFEHPKELGEKHLPRHAESLSLDVKTFEECLQSGRHLDEVDQDAKDAGAVSLTGTPSFIVGRTTADRITGQVVIGAQPLNVFNSAIDKALKDKK